MTDETNERLKDLGDERITLIVHYKDASAEQFGVNAKEVTRIYEALKGGEVLEFNTMRDQSLVINYIPSDRVQRVEVRL